MLVKCWHSTVFLIWACRHYYQKLLGQPTTTNTIDTYKILLRFFLCREKVQDSQVEDGWRSKQGTYTGVMMYVNDRFVDPEELEPLDDHCTRLVLNKPGGRIQLTRFLYKYRSQDPTTVRLQNFGLPYNYWASARKNFGVSDKEDSN